MAVYDMKEQEINLTDVSIFLVYFDTKVLVKIRKLKSF
jgi:hypothetical protein